MSYSNEMPPAPQSEDLGRVGVSVILEIFFVVLFFLLVDTSHILPSVNPCCPFQVSSQSVTF